MKDCKYEFKYTKENGYQEATLPDKLQDKLFQYRKSSWKYKYIFFVNKEKNIIEMCRFTPPYLKVILTLMYPFLVLVHGIGNIKHLHKEFHELYHEKVCGSFSGDTIYKKEGSNLYEELLVNLKFKENK